MKKIFLFILMLVVIYPVCVKADDHIYNMDINIYLDESGTARITELWDVQADGGSEWCKRLSNLEKSNIKGFYVMMDDKELVSKEWGPNGSVRENAYRYGIRYVRGGYELCFGKVNNERHIFKFGYELSNYIFNIDDGQVLYHVLAPKVKVDAFYADIIAYYSLPDDLELLKYGYEGDSYIDQGKIIYSNHSGIDNKYVTALVKFPNNTFDTKKNIEKFKTFDDVKLDAENKGYEYKDIKRGLRFIFLDFVFIVLGIGVVLLIIEFIYRKVKGKSLLENKIVLKIINFVVNLFKKIVKLFKELFIRLKGLFNNVLLKSKGKNKK